MQLEKKSFLFGIVVCSFIGFMSKLCGIAIHVLCFLCVVCSVAYYIINKQWTNHLSEEIFLKALEKKLEYFKQQTDERSTAVLDYLQRCIYESIFWTNGNFFKKRVRLPRFQYEYKQQWLKEYEKIKEKYKTSGIKHFFPETFFFHHGLRFASKKVCNYIRNKDILDCGAFIGDSVTVLRPYTDGIIYSFELSRKNGLLFLETMKRNQIKRYVLIEEGVSDKASVINICDTGSVSTGYSCGNDVSKMTTIDDEVNNRHINVGFIKADIEGFGLNMVRGALNTIKSQRPVMSIGIYHNYEELLELKPFLEHHIENYIYEFQLHKFSEGKFVELFLFCYPKELSN